MKLVPPENAILRRSPSIVEDPKSPEILELVKEMYEFLEKNNGVGLSANQIGIDKRIFVLSCSSYKEAFINPEITSFSSQTVLLEEGCLSYPGVFAHVKRPIACNISYYNERGELQTDTNFGGITSRIIQHEYDHMEGRFFYHHLSNLQFERFKKRLKKNGFSLSY